MHLFGRQRPIMITTSNSSVKRSGTPNQYARCSTAHHGDFRAVPRANRILELAGNPIVCATSNTDERLASVTWLTWRSSDTAATYDVNICYANCACSAM